MAINKNFVISNGLEVNTDLLYADSDTKRVGINSAIPDYELDVIGSVSISGAISAGGTTGEVGSLLESTGNGIRWRPIEALRVVENYNAVEGQTIFPSSGFFPFDNVDFLDVFVDGVKLAQDEYTGYDGNTRIQLLVPSLGGETVEVVAYSANVVAAGYTGIQGLTVAEEGTVIGLSDGVKLINFVGAYITAIGSGAGVTVFLDDRLAQDTNFWISNVSGLSTTTNVGIKNTSPTRTLDVTGDARITSGLEAGSVFSSGVSTFSDVVIGGATTELVVTGDARITGILTIGTSSITIDGIRNEIKIGTALTLNQSGNAYVTGIVTAQAFDGDGANVSNVDAVTLVGLGSDSFLRADANDSFTGTLSGSGSINISGVATASRISATTGSVATLSGTTLNYTNGNIVTGVVTNLSGTNASYSGIGTVGSLNIGATQVISSGRQLQNIASLDATTTATIESAISNAPNTFTDLNVSGIGTIATLGATTGTVTTLSGTTLNYTNGNIVTGVVTTLSGTSFNYTGVSTATTLFSTTANAARANIVTGIVTNLSGTNASYSGIGTFGSLNIGATQIVSSGRQLQNIASLDATTTATIESAVQSAPNNFDNLNVTGIATLGAGATVTGTTFTNQLSVSGIATASSFSGNLANTLTLNTSGTGLSGSATFNNSGSSTFTVASNATSDNTNSAIVSRNSTGGFSAGIITATFDGNATTASYTPLSGVSTYSDTAGISTYATSSGIATYSTTAGVSTDVVGGLGSLSQIIVSGVSTFTSGPVFIGTDTSTGTSGQLIQIDSGAYVSGSVGVGTTNPTSKLSVVGGDISVGISTAHGVILTSPNGTQYRLIVDDSGNLSTTAV
jgi:hypothetical protein